MEELLQWLKFIEDTRQQRKVRHQLKDIVLIVLFATLANADDWVEIAMFAELKNGIPSHDTLCRVMGLISPEVLQQVYGKWQDLLNREDGEILKKIIAVDGKTMRGNTDEDSRKDPVKKSGLCSGVKGKPRDALCGCERIFFG